MSGGCLGWQQQGTVAIQRPAMQTIFYSLEWRKFVSPKILYNLPSHANHMHDTQACVESICTTILKVDHSDHVNHDYVLDQALIVTIIALPRWPIVCVYTNPYMFIRVMII